MKIKRIGSTSATEITKEDGTIVLVSYSTPVAACIPGEGFSVTSKKFNVTTSRQINQWLGRAQASSKPQAFFDALI